MNPKLVAVSGPLSGKSFELGDKGLTLGRDRSSDLHLRDLSVSRSHCVVELADGGARVRDLESRHGTFVNGVPVRERRLEHGDLLAVGGSLFVFQNEEEEERGEAVLDDLPDLPYWAESTVHLPVERARYLRAEAGVPDARAARDLQALLRIGNDLHTLRGTDPLARRLLELVLETVPAGRAALVLLDRTGEPAASFALDRQGSTALFPISRTLARKIVEEKSAVLSNDALQSPGWRGAESVHAARLQSLAAAPLTAPPGILYADTREPGAAFDPNHLELLTAIAGIASVAFANVRHVERLEEESRRSVPDLSRDMVGESLRMREVWRLLGRAAPADSTVLIRGESGTGKELAARALHRGSRRARGPFVAINCATLSETLLESELFGHEKGAFTGAVARKTGKIEAAEGGTLFLDEIGELSPPLQAKLLRVLQEREFERLGSTRPIKADVRIVAATNRDLERAIREGAFREDLFYRLNVISLTLPPLRERREDIPLLAAHFAAHFGRKLGRRIAGFTPEARTCLLRYDWPGNVRELANAVERAAVLGEGELIRPEDLPEALAEVETTPSAEGGVSTYHGALNQTKRRLILDAVERAGGSVTRAAEILGLHPNYLHRLISNLGLRSRIKG